MAGYWRFRNFALPLDRTLVMGVVNVTPDSFSDGGLFQRVADAVDHGRRLAGEGADILDIGGESTRPGAAPVSTDEERGRVLPVIEALAAGGHCVSVDTRHADVAAAALDAGAAIVNDVTAGESDDEMFDVVARRRAGLVLMHMQGEPQTMQENPEYDDVVDDVGTYLAARVDAAVRAGVREQAVAVDPGIGFGKTLAHNLALLAGIPRIAATGRPVLIGTSRKSMFAKLLDLAVDERMEATLATTVWAAMAGASIVRVHDVKETVQATKVTDAALALVVR